MAQGWRVDLCRLKFMVAPVPPVPTLKMFLVLFLPATPLPWGDATPPLRLPAKRTGKAELLPARKKVPSRLRRWHLLSFAVLSP